MERLVSPQSPVNTSSARIALGIEYNGTPYNGWQKQKNPHVVTVQHCLEVALAKVANHPVKLYCAGRTDTGVHATGQVVHFDSPANRPEKAWLAGTNTFLDKSISVQWAAKVDENFHARFSATSRRYRYFIYNSKVRSALLDTRVTLHHRMLDAQAMHEASQHLLGRHDFTAYRGVACQSPTAVRDISFIQVTRLGNIIMVEVEANAFLLHMVRNIVGVLLSIGEGGHGSEWALEVLQSRDRKLAGITAPPHGLYLVKVGYPEQYQFPVAGDLPLQFGLV